MSDKLVAKRWLGIVHATIACIAALGVVAAFHVLGASAMNSLPVTGNISAVPERSGTVLQTLAEADLPRSADGAIAVSGQQAIETTMTRWGLTPADIDPQAGVVRAVFHRDGSGKIAGRKVWIVTANVDTMSQGPARSRHFVTHKLCTVIDARTGEYLMAYTAGPPTFVE